ncbi:hypothetical protein RFI_18783, partial [Reticulomyxa filosa]
MATGRKGKKRAENTETSSINRTSTLPCPNCGETRTCYSCRLSYDFSIISDSNHIPESTIELNESTSTTSIFSDIPITRVSSQSFSISGDGLSGEQRFIIIEKKKKMNQIKTFFLFWGNPGKKKKKCLVRMSTKQLKNTKEFDHYLHSGTTAKEPIQILNLRTMDEKYLQPLPTVQGNFRWVVLNVQDLSLISNHNGNSKVLMDSINDCVDQTNRAHVILVQIKDLLLCISHSGSKAPISERTNLSFCIEHIKRYFAL